jgi:acylphosphatase
MNERRVVYYSGNVQGVGFRYTTKRISASFAVAGYVRNLSDGRVHVVAEGLANDLDAFFASVQSTMGENIEDVVMESAAANGEFVSFAIRH